MSFVEPSRGRGEVSYEYRIIIESSIARNRLRVFCRRIGPALDAGFFIFGSKVFRTFRRARNALGVTQGRRSLTTEEAGKTRSSSFRIWSEVRRV